jgi:predicted SprT family Zn-dependent metalloprotease
MNISEAISLSNQMLKEHMELRDWKTVTNNRKRAFGVCSYRKKEIELSNILIPVMTDEAIKDTIIHEIAHALTKGHGHDRVWQRKCLELGGDGQRCGGSDNYFKGSVGQKEILSKISKYTLTCPECGEKSYRNRKPNRNLSCGECCSYYNPKYKLVLTQNY